MIREREFETYILDYQKEKIPVTVVYEVDEFDDIVEWHPYVEIDQERLDIFDRLTAGECTEIDERVGKDWAEERMERSR